MAWAFQRESELLPIFKYYLDKMKQTGVINRLRQKFIGNIGDTGTSKIQDLQGLGYDSVVLPFLTLLIGLCVAFMQLGIETAIICKKKCSEDEKLSREDNSTSEKAKEIIEDINHLIVENHRKLGGIKFLSKMRVQLTLPDACP